MRYNMLFLRDVTSNNECEVEVDYYVPFTINVGNEKLFSPKVCWRIGNFKTSLMEICIDEKSGVLRDITLTSVDRAYLEDKLLENVSVAERGTPVFLLEGNVKNGLCDQVMDFNVYLGKNYIMVNFTLERYPEKIIELDRVQFYIGQNNQLISVIVKDLSFYEYNELKEGLKV